jgi:putative addiction module killer protein
MDRLQSTTFNLRTLPDFDAWLRAIASMAVRQRLLTRLRKASRGSLGDIKAIGGGILEMREHFGPGWRMYFIRHGHDTIIMLLGGTRSSQQADIKAAQRLARRIVE